MSFINIITVGLFLEQKLRGNKEESNIKKNNAWERKVLERTCNDVDVNESLGDLLFQRS
jgi:hypothetical protein